MNVAGREDSRRDGQPSALARGAIGLVRLYQNAISVRRPASCRFVPTCSEYAVDAVREWGALRGAALALARLARCGPWHRGGWDPVPTRDEAIRANRTGDSDYPGFPEPAVHVDPSGHSNSSGHSCHVGHSAGLIAHGAVIKSPGAATAPAVSSRSD